MFTEPITVSYWIKAVLKPDEDVFWSGQPDPRRIINTRDIIFIPFGIAMGIPLTIILPKTGLISWLIILAWSIGIFYVIGKLFMRFLDKRNTYYVLTSRRVLVLVKQKDKALVLRNIPWEAMVAVTHSLRNDELGTLVFEELMPAGPRGQHEKFDLGVKEQPFSSDLPAFMDIRDSKELYDTINQIRYRNYRHILGDWGDGGGKTPGR